MRPNPEDTTPVLHDGPEIGPVVSFNLYVVKGIGAGIARLQQRSARNKLKKALSSATPHEKNMSALELQYPNDVTVRSELAARASKLGARLTILSRIQADRAELYTNTAHPYITLLLTGTANIKKVIRKIEPDIDVDPVRLLQRLTELDASEAQLDDADITGALILEELVDTTSLREAGTSDSIR